MPALEPHLSRMGIAAERISVLPTGGDPYYKRIDPSAPAAWRQRHALQEKFVILYAGSFNDQYGIDTALEAARRLDPTNPEIAWVFIGNGRQRPQVEEAAAKLDSVTYLGSLPKDELMPAIMAADLGFDSLGTWPMLYIIMPGKLFDYLASGTAALTTNDGLAGAMVEAAGAGFVLKEPTAEQLVETVRRAAALPREELAAMGAHGQQWVLSRVNSIDMARESAEIVADVYRRRKGRRRLLRLFGAAIRACLDVLTRRSARSTERMLQGDLRQTSRDSLDAWLANRPAPSRPTLQWRVPMSPLLSCRDEPRC